MSDLPVLSVLIAIPLVGAIVTAFLPAATARLAGVGFAGAALLWAAIAALSAYDLDGGMQLTETHAWIEALGVHYALGVDGLGLVMVLLTVALVPIVLVASWHEADEEGNGGSRNFVAWVLALEAMSLAVFTATDVFLFYVVFEATLIPAYFLIGGFGRSGRGRAAMKFLIYQLAGGLVMLASVIGLYVVSANAGNPSFLISDLAALDIDPITQRWLFVGFFVAFAIKAPLFPVHTWLPDTTGAATPGTSVLLICVLDKIGTYGMLRFCLEIFPEASRWATPVVVVMALISIVYGAMLAIGQDDMLKLIGLTSLSHFGFIVLGIFVMNSQGISGATFYMLNHGLATAILFLAAGYLIRRRGTQLISEQGGHEKAAPVLAGLFLVGGLGTLGLPGLSPFVSEFLVLLGAFDHAVWVGAIAVTGIVLAAVYVLRMYQRTMTGPPSVEAGAMGDLSVREVGALAPLVLAMVLLGFHPQPVLDVINPATEAFMEAVGAEDDQPTVEAPEEAHP